MVVLPVLWVFSAGAPAETSSRALDQARTVAATRDPLLQRMIGPTRSATYALGVLDVVPAQQDTRRFLAHSENVCEVTPTAQIELPLDRLAAAIARRFLREQLCTAHHATVEDEAELLVSELIGNGVRHGMPPIVVTVECDGSAGLRVSVRDHDPTPPVRREAGNDDESGRGITLVDLISDAWGVETDRQGKSVWFCLNRSTSRA